MSPKMIWKKLRDLKSIFQKSFEIKELKRLKYLLGIKVPHLRNKIFISQHKYILNLLKKIEILGCKPIDSPIEPNHKLG